MQFATTRSSVDCPCGGRHCNVPEIRQRHTNTYKHQTWMFQTLCEEFLTLTSRQDKVKLLLKMRDVLRRGKVKM